MANDSTFKYFVRFPASRFLHDAPLDTAYARDIVVNNAEHLYSSHGQIRVNWVSESGLQSNTLSVGETQLLRSFGPFPISIRKDGRPFALLCEVSAECALTGALWLSLRREGANPPSGIAHTDDAIVSGANHTSFYQLGRNLTLVGAEHYRLTNLPSRLSASSVTTVNTASPVLYCRLDATFVPSAAESKLTLWSVFAKEIESA